MSDRWTRARSRAHPFVDGIAFDADFTRNPKPGSSDVNRADSPFAHVGRNDGLDPMNGLDGNHDACPTISLVNRANSMVPSNAVTASAAHAIAGIMLQHP